MRLWLPPRPLPLFPSLARARTRWLDMAGTDVEVEAEEDLLSYWQEG